MFFTSSLISGANLEAEVLRGLKKGVIFRDLSMELHLHTHRTETLGFRGPHQQQDYQVSRERVYRGQLPLHLVLGVNIIRRDLRVQWLRPAPAPPLVLALHARTSVAV